MKKQQKKKKVDNKKIYMIGGGLLLAIITICVLVFVVPKFMHNEEKSEKQKVDKQPKMKLNIVDLDSNTRNTAVMINNISTVWGYQSGVQDAYIVYEMIVEGGITRMMALYRDVETPRIGSVRSSRAYFLDYVLENDALYIHDGGSWEALNDIKTFKIADFNANTTWRDNTFGLKAPHNEFTNMEKIFKKAEEKKIATTSEQPLLLNYTDQEIDLSTMEGAKVANNITMDYSNINTRSYTYDPEAKVYKRFQNGKAHTDYNTKEQYTAKNIITYQVENVDQVGDKKGRQSLYNIGTGTGYFLTNGYAIPITWEKASRESQTVYKYMNGEELVVSDGNTFIQIQPKNKNLTIN